MRDLSWALLVTSSYRRAEVWDVIVGYTGLLCAQIQIPTVDTLPPVDSVVQDGMGAVGVHTDCSRQQRADLDKAWQHFTRINGTRSVRGDCRDGFVTT